MTHLRVTLAIFGASLTIGIFSLLKPALAEPPSQVNTTGSSNCTAADFDVTLKFVRGPESTFSVIVNQHNISDHPCLFDTQYGPSFVPDRAPGGDPFPLCYDCENGAPIPRKTPTPAFSVNPGQAAQEIFRWKTKTPNDAVQCLRPQWMAAPVVLVAPSLSENVCSPIDVSRFSLAPAGPVQGAIEGPAEDDASRAFDLSSPRSTYYANEFFPIHVSIHQSGPAAVHDDTTCPTFYLRQRSPDGFTRIDEVHPAAFKPCGPMILGYEPGNWTSGFDLTSGANNRWMGLGEHTLQIFQTSGWRDDGQLHFYASNVLQIQIADASIIPRKWNGKLKGIAADLTLDKVTFRVGEDVPLHIAIENLDAGADVYGPDPVWDPCAVVNISVQNADGKPLPDSERLPPQSICTGHGRGPRPYAKGTVIPLERTLGSEGWLPKHPGVYTLVVTWTPCMGTGKTSGQQSEFGAPSDLKPYATVRTTAVVQIVDR